MPTFNYIALDRRGSEQSGKIDALNPRQAGVMLRERGLFPTEVLPLSAPGVVVPFHRGGRTLTARKSFELRMPFVAPVKSRDLAAFTRQLGTLIHAGMPLLRSLQTLS